MPRTWEAHYTAEEAAAFERWADEFLSELTARVDYARAKLTADNGEGETLREAMLAIHALVNDDENGIVI